MKVGIVFNISRLLRKGETDTPKNRAANSVVRFSYNVTEPLFFIY